VEGVWDMGVDCREIDDEQMRNTASESSLTRRRRRAPMHVGQQAPSAATRSTTVPCVLLCASMTLISVLAGIELHQQYEKPGPGQDCGRMAGHGSPRLSAELDNQKMSWKMYVNGKKYNLSLHDERTMNEHKSRQTLILYGDTLTHVLHIYLPGMLLHCRLT
jgi:hypothetical protein